MENNQLKDFYDLKHMERTPVVCVIKALSDVGDSTPADGMDSQRFISATIVELDNDDTITTGGSNIGKTFFENTHPAAFVKLLAWKDLDDAMLAAKKVNGFIVSVPTKREFIRFRRDRDEQSKTFGDLVPMMNNITKKVQTGSMMTFFILKNENVVSELRRRGTQLEKRKGWLNPVTTTDVGSVEDEL